MSPPLSYVFILVFSFYPLKDKGTQKKTCLKKQQQNKNKTKERKKRSLTVKKDSASLEVLNAFSFGLTFPGSSITLFCLCEGFKNTQILSQLAKPETVSRASCAYVPFISVVLAFSLNKMGLGKINSFHI